MDIIPDTILRPQRKRLASSRNEMTVNSRFYLLSFLLFFTSRSSHATPLGFGLFCLTNPHSIDCRRQSGRVGTLQEAQQVKSSVDRRFLTRNDYQDDWSLLTSSHTRGDCEDRACRKLKCRRGSKPC